MIKGHDEIAVFLGLDVGKGEHHAVGLDRTGKRLLDRALPNDEASGGSCIGRLGQYGALQVVRHRLQDHLRVTNSDRSNRCNRSTSTRAAIETITPSLTVNPITETGRRPTVTTTPAAPLMSAGWTVASGRANISARPATAAAPGLLHALS